MHGNVFNSKILLFNVTKYSILLISYLYDRLHLQVEMKRVQLDCL